MLHVEPPVQLTVLSVPVTPSQVDWPAQVDMHDAPHVMLQLLRASHA